MYAILYSVKFCQGKTKSLYLYVHLEGKTLANLVSAPLPFNALIMFGWENFSEFTDICQSFPPPQFCAIRCTIRTLSPIIAHH